MSTSAAAANHKHIHDKNLSDFMNWSCSKGKNIQEHEWGGENPVDRREGSGNFFDPHAASFGEHLKNKACLLSISLQTFGNAFKNQRKASQNFVYSNKKKKAK